MTVMAVFSMSCIEEEVVHDASLTQYSLIASIDKPLDASQTRSCVDITNENTTFIGLLWQPGDKIGVYSQDGKSRNYEFTSTATNNVPQAEFTGEMSVTPYYAYYPYNADNANIAHTAIKGSVLSEQPFDHGTGTIVCDYKYGQRASDGTNNFKFKQLFTMLRITIDASDTGLEGKALDKIVLKVTDPNGNPRPICGDFTFNVVDGSWTAGSTTSNSVSMPWTKYPKLDKGESYLGFITVMPVVKTGDKIYIEVDSDTYKASFTAECKVDFEAGYFYDIPLKLSSYAANTDKFGYVETARPTMNSFSFEVAKNSEKLLNNKLKWSNNEPVFDYTVTSHQADIKGDDIKIMIPYLYDFKLTPTFTYSSGATVTVNGKSVKSGESEIDFAEPVTFTVSLGGESRDYTVSVTNTGLPVVVLKHSSDISEGYDKKTDWSISTGTTIRNQFVDFMIRHKDSDWAENDEITVYPNDDSAPVTITCGAKLRGNTSQKYPKKPFAIKLTSKVGFLNMPAHKRWVLLANWLDHSMIRNAVAFDIAHAIEKAWMENSTIDQGIPWNVHGQNVELVVFSKEGVGHHVGNYYLCEQIKIDEGRLNITSPDGADTGTDYTQYGYLLEVDNNYDETCKFKTSRSVPFMFKDEVSDDILSAVQTKVQGIENNIYNGNFSEAYEELDLNTVIDQWLIWELTMNREYGDPRSVYMFMNGDGKLSAGPVWDFDRGTFQYIEGAKKLGNTDRIKPYNEWICWRTSSNDTYIWYKELIQDHIFQQRVKDRWAVMLPYLQGVLNTIEGYREVLRASYKEDSAMWPTNKSAIQAHKSGFDDWSGDEEINDWDQLINQFKTSYSERLNGMNDLITSGNFTGTATTSSTNTAVGVDSWDEELDVL